MSARPADVALMAAKAVVLVASWLGVVFGWAWAFDVLGAIRVGAAGHGRPVWLNGAVWLICIVLPEAAATAGAVYATRGKRPWLWYRLGAACVPGLALAISTHVAHVVLAGR